MGAKNKVIAGDYEGRKISSLFGIVQIEKIYKQPAIIFSKDVIEEYEVMDAASQKSAVSAVGRAFAGSLVLGPVGLFAGLTAKSKGTHTIALSFKDGKKSLIEVDDKINKSIMKLMF